MIMQLLWRTSSTTRTERARGGLPCQELHLKKIRTLFNQLDSDEAGLITYEMLKDNFKKADVSEYFESLGLDVTDAWTFFKLLDLDRGGERCVY